MPRTTPNIISGDLWRLELPAGRVIGDNNCRYECFSVVAVRLESSAGHIGWGYDDSCWKGIFNLPAWYIRPMASLDELRAVFSREWQPRLKANGLNDAQLHDFTNRAGYAYLDGAVRMALFDLMAQDAKQPLYQYLGGNPERNRVRAYGSVLDFHLSDEDAVSLACSFVDRGFNAIKVKIGAPDVARDIARLQAVQSGVGPDIELTADANQIWDAETAIRHLGAIADAGIELGYIEDPLPYTDIAGFATVNAAVPIDVIGHDYVHKPEDLRALLEAGGIERIRAGRYVDDVLASSRLAAEFHKPLVFGNSIFESNVHLACALPNVDRLEFSDLARNELIAQPVRFEDGYAIAPDVPGHGLAPDTERLKHFELPEG